MRPPEVVRGDPSLAANGGRAPRPEPRLEYGVVTEAADAVADVVRSGITCYWRGGEKTRALEAVFAEKIGRRGAFFHTSGSGALISGLHALGAEYGTPVGISSAGFVASLNAVYHCRARPLFLPTDPATLVVSCESDPGFVVAPEILLVTQFFGNLIDIDRLRALWKPRAVLEDASQALGSWIHGVPVGSHGEVATFAGSVKKLLGSGTGGINVYDDPELGERMRILAHHGKGHRQYAEVPGFNFFGGEIEATLALAAMERLEDRATARNATGEAMLEVLSGAGLRCGRPPAGVDGFVAWFDVAVVLPDAWRGPHRDWLVAALQAEGVPAWFYPALIDMPWVKPWLEAEGWWSERDEDVLRHEKDLWDRTFVIATQMDPEDGVRCARECVRTLCGDACEA